ncbi:MAG: WecB/TagA/CpsF family glycosyltransferase [Parachlamydiales bacterium]|jgi:N-acetylglucosaminyldiphosphoundecaprenol N-acetyl-beta-D-mannosaminyltransferase
MQRDQKFILGIGIDNVSLNEAVQEIISIIKDYPSDPRARYIATINTDFINNSLCWNWPHIKNSELLSLLRRSSLSTCDSTPLYWLSKLLGSSLKERVAGSNLLLPLLYSVAQNNFTVFLLGGTETDAQLAAARLTATIKNLKIVGIATPRLATEGPLLAVEPERDALLLEQIHSAKPDLLLVNLGNPKQELWFARVSSELKVPASIGIGGCFSFLSGSLLRAPEWMQKGGLEWLYRIFQEPGRLWKRYFFGIPKALYMALPAVFYQRYCSFMYRLVYRNVEPILEKLRIRLYLASTRSIAVLELPSKLSNAYHEIHSDLIDQAFAHDHIVVDFKRVRHITLEGISFLVGLWTRAHRQDKELSGLSLSGDMRLLLKANRAWDILSAQQYQTVKDLATTLQQSKYNSLYDTIHQDNKSIYISFFGQLDNNQDYERIFTRFEPTLKDRHCTVDLTYCTTIESRGFSFLLRLKAHLQQQNRKLRLCCIHEEIRRQFELARLDKIFECIACRP